VATARSPDELKRYVQETAVTIGLSIAPEDLPIVLAVFANLANVAAPLMEFPLPEEAEPAPIFIPRDVPL
jgi:hypothetical protein